MIPETKVAVCSKDYWDELLARSNDASVFCTSQFLSMLAPDWVPLVVQSAGRPTLFAPVLKRASQVLMSPFSFSLYTGPMQTEELSQMPTHRRVPILLESLNALIEYARREYALVSWCAPPNFSDLRPFQWYGYGNPAVGSFKIDLRYTAIASLTPELVPKETFRTNRLRDYQKAQSRGCQFGLDVSVEELAQVVQETYDRSGGEIASSDIELMCQVATTAVSGNWGRVYGARGPDGKLWGAALFLRYQARSYFLHGGSYSEHLKEGVTSFLMINSLLDLAKTGSTHLDFCGANSPRRGDFKASLGGEIHPYYVLNWQA